MNQYRSLFHLSLLALAISICYGGTLNHTFHFDDQPNIIKSENQHLTKLTWQGIKKACYFDEGGSLGQSKVSRPISRITLALNYYFHGLNVRGYHIVNIAIHILTTFFLYFLFFEILKIYNFSLPNSRHEIAFLQDIALFGAFLWAMHPIHTQAITYIIQRMASLAAMFYILAFYMYVRGRCEQKIARRVIMFALSACCWILGVFSKENAIFLPAAIIAFELLFFRINKKALSKLFFLLAFLGFLSITYCLISEINIVETLTQSYKYRSFTMWERLLTEHRIIWRYIFLLFTPLQNFLTLESDILKSTSFVAPWTTLPSIIGVFLLLIAAWRVRKKLPLISFAIFFYFINHFVESTFIPLELYFEHRNYLPSTFIYLTVAWYLAKTWQYYTLKNKLFLKWLVILSSVFIMTSEAVATWLRNDVWLNDLSLFTDSIQKSPENLRSHGTLAVYHLSNGDYDESKKQLKIGENLYKKYPNRYQNNNIALIYYNAGVLHVKLGNYEKSQRLFLRSLQFDSKFETFINFASSSFKIKQFDQAKKAMSNALPLAVNNNHKALTFNMLACIYYQQGETEKALNILQDGLKYDPLAIIRINIMSCYLKLGNTEAAKKMLRYTESDDNDILLLLIRAILTSEGNNSDIFSRIADLLIRKKIDYCKWIQGVKKNDQLGVIGPDITSIEDQLLNAYHQSFDKNITLIQDVKELASNCFQMETQSQNISSPAPNNL